MNQPAPDTLKSTSPWKKWLILVLSILVLIAVGLYLLEVEDTVDVKSQTEPPSPPLVGFKAVKPAPHKIKIFAHAEVKPRWSASLSAAVTGKVIAVNPSALAGGKVVKGEHLLRIEASRYQVELTSAERAIKQAELDLWQAKNANLLATKQFRRDNRKPPNGLALKLPQLNIAEAALKESEARLKFARQQMADTIVKVPFSGFVTERFVSPGQSINAGDKLVKLVDSSVFELEVSLGHKDWQRLAHPMKTKKADLISRQGQIMGRAVVREAGGFLDPSTRQYKLFLEMPTNEQTDVLVGAFVKVALEGMEIEGALVVPEGAVTQDGVLWYIDEEDHLQRWRPEILHRSNGAAILRSPKTSQTGLWRIVSTPLASFLPGQAVTPKNLLLNDPASITGSN